MNKSIALFITCLTGTMLTQTAEAVEIVCDHKTLSTKTPEELRLTRNTVFAKHGRQFKSADLNAHFSQQSWYTPNAKYSDSMLSEEDKRCVESVGLWEKGKPKQTLEVDLDGDGTLDNAYLFDFRPKDKDDCSGCEGAECYFTIAMFNHNVQVKANWGQGSWTEDAEKFNKIDLFFELRDPSTRWGEQFQQSHPGFSHLPTHIYLQQKSDECEDPPNEYTILSLYKDRLDQVVLESESWSNDQVESSGLGFLKFVKDTHCNLHVTEWYSWKDDKLIKIRTEETFHPKHSWGTLTSFITGVEEGYCGG